MLGDAQRRQMYDRFGHAGPGGGAGRGGGLPLRRHRRPLRELLRRRGAAPAGPAAGGRPAHAGRADLRRGRLRRGEGGGALPLGVLPHLRRVRRRAGQAPDHLRPVRGHGRGAPHPAVHLRAVRQRRHLRPLPGRGHHRAAPLPGVRRQRAAEAPAQDQAAHPRRRGRRDRDAGAGAGRGRRPGRAQRQPLRAVRRAAPPGAQARRDRPGLRAAPQRGRGRPGDGAPGAHAGGRGDAERPRRDAARARLPHPRQGRPPPAARRAGATSGWSCAWRCPRTSAPASGSC